ncbi:MAG: radical SAM protein [Candidatus Sumerlaeota bacterium]
MTDTQTYKPMLIAWEVTRTCNLACKHCRAGAQNRRYEQELSTEECKEVLESIAAFCKPIIILTGGEPMLRGDIFQIASYGTSLGLRMVMAPCGYLITPETVHKMKDSGIQRISLSIDAATAEKHDAFRGVPGAFDTVMRAAEVVRQNGLDFQVNTTIHKGNIDELPEILDLAIQLGAKAFHPFLLVPTGRASNMAGQEISAEQYEEVLEWVYSMQEKTPILFKPTCAPHYHRIARQKGGAPKAHPHAKGHPGSGHPGGLQSLSKGCMGGQSFAFISHVGKVQICGFLEESAGDLRESELDFRDIWDHSKLFQDVRNIDGYSGKCGYCEFRKVCGGCRARAFAMSGDYLAEEPFCIYTPKNTPKED